jgi:ubiquinone/menaquinone biosynthesis C-methylase UbiE
MSGISLEKARLYEKYRLPYASEAVKDLCKSVTAHKVVADIGAGTGQLARLLAGKSKKVYVVEPDPAMREIASLSLANFAEVIIRAASAEQTTLTENSIDLIVIGNAFHRFKPQALNELRRILKRHGWIALFSYSFTDVAFAEMLFTKLATLKDVAERMDKTWHRMSAQELFGECPIFKLSYPQSYTEDWTAFFGAACSGIEAPEKEDGEFAEFENLNREVFDAFAVNGKLKIEYETRIMFGQPHCL